MAYHDSFRPRNKVAKIDFTNIGLEIVIQLVFDNWELSCLTKRMKYPILLLILLLVACDNEAPKTEEYFEAKITNSSENDFDLYLGTTSRLNDFEFISIVEVSESIYVDSLKFSTNYVCRITCVGEPVSQYYYEIPFRIEIGDTEINILQSKIE